MIVVDAPFCTTMACLSLLQILFFLFWTHIFNESASYFNMHWIYKQLDKRMGIYLEADVFMYFTYMNSPHVHGTIHVHSNGIYWKYHYRFFSRPFSYMHQTVSSQSLFIQMSTTFWDRSQRLSKNSFCNYFIVRLWRWLRSYRLLKLYNMLVQNAQLHIETHTDERSPIHAAIKYVWHVVWKSRRQREWMPTND